MKNLKRSNLIAFIFIFFLIIAGIFLILKLTIGNANKENEAEKMKSYALEYLNNNYSDTFTALSYTSPSWAYDYSAVNFWSKKYSDTVIVRINEENGTYSFKDNYFELTMKEDAEKYFEALASKYGCNVESKVRFISLGEGFNIDANARFTDYISIEKCHIELYFISKDTFSTQQINSILNEMASNKILGNFRFVVTSDEKLLSDYAISEIVNEQSDKVISKESYSIDGNFKYNLSR